MNFNLDKSAWKRVSLGDVAAASKEKVDPSDGSVARYVAGEHMDTNDLKLHRWGNIGEVDLGPAFHRRFRPGQVLYGSRRTYLRKVAVADFSGVCSNTTFVVESKDAELLLQRFLPFVMTSEPFHSFAVAESKGSVNPYVNWSDIARFEFDLPSIAEQEHIADLIWAVERHKRALDQISQRVRNTLQLQLVRSIGTFDSRRRLGDLTSIRSGPSYAASNVFPTAVEGSIPVLGIPNTRPDGKIDLTAVNHVKGISESTETVDETSLILIRTNGNRKRIGNVYLPPSEARGYAVSAFQFLMKVADPSYRDYLYWVLRTDTMQERMSDAASGTTGLGNLAVRWLNEQEIPWPATASERDHFLAIVSSYIDAENSISDEKAKLSTLRSSLLADIVGGT